MSKAQSENELTSTLHLGLRSVVADSPSDQIANLLAHASEEERAVIESVIAGDGSKAMVLIHRGAQKGARFLLTQEVTGIGRSPESSIFLDDVTVSRKHSEIHSEIHGEVRGFRFIDCGSLNGSYINNELVKDQLLKSGDEIQIGKFHMLFIGASPKPGER